MNYHDAITAWNIHQSELESKGVFLPNVTTYIPDEWRSDFTLAMDAQPQLVTDPNSAIPAMLTSMIDPEVIRIVFTPNKAIEVLGEQKRGTWVDDVIFFPVVEQTGEVSSYGDYNNNGRAGVNASWPQRQQCLFQIVKEYGERELDRAGLAKINLAAEIDRAAANIMNRFLNFSYLFGIQGLQNYGLVNDPSLSAAATPATKALGGTAWVDDPTGQIRATANEIYADIQALFYQLVKQTYGYVNQDSPMLLVIGTASSVGLTATNSFDVNVRKLLEGNFPNLRIVTIPQYNAQSMINTNGMAAGNFAQLWALDLEGQNTGFAAYSEKYREHPMIRHMSSFRQKASGGTWGAVIRVPAAVSSMVGI